MIVDDDGPRPPRFYETWSQATRDVEEVWYTFGVVLVLLLPMLVGWEVLRHRRPVTPQRVSAVTFVYTAVTAIALTMALQWTDIGSSAQGTVLGVVMSLSIAGAEMSRNSTAVVYGVESRLCTSISVVASIFVVLREEAQALGIVCMFYATTLVWSIVVTLSNLMLKHTNPDQHRAEECEHPDKWFGALNRAIHEPVKFRVYANRYSSTGDGRADGSSTRKAKKKSKKGS